MKKSRLIYIWLPIILAATFGLGMWVSYMLYKQPELTKGQEKFNNILNTIKDKYVDEVDIDSLIERTIPYLISNLDPHSMYISADELEKANAELEGSFSGVGVSFQIMNDTICVVEIIPGGPAQRMGLKAGDRIVTIDGVSAIGFKNEEVFEKLRGQKGTNVVLGVKRPPMADITDYTLTRDDIPVKSVSASYMMDGGLGYVKVEQFSRNTYNEFITALNHLRLQGATRFIVDLRGNPGGYMEPAVLMVNEFLYRGQPIVQTLGRNMTEQERLPICANGGGSFAWADIAVLIDESSASASEIFAGAIQDNDRGLVIGRRSFGKGLVQQQIMLPDNSALRLTVQRYYTPSGRCIQKDYKPGDNLDYDAEIYNRYNSGEAYNPDSIKVDKSKAFTTLHGRTVYGGGGIIPDIYVPNDTIGYNRYYRDILDANLIPMYAFEYVDMNREDLSKARTLEQLLEKLPSDNTLLNSFAYYIKDHGKELRWYYLKHSSATIVNQIKALIARDVLGMDALYKILGELDTPVVTAAEKLRSGQGKAPILITHDE